MVAYLYLFLNHAFNSDQQTRMLLVDSQVDNCICIRYSISEVEQPKSKYQFCQNYLFCATLHLELQRSHKNECYYCRSEGEVYLYVGFEDDFVEDVILVFSNIFLLISIGKRGHQENMSV